MFRKKALGNKEGKDMPRQTHRTYHSSTNTPTLADSRLSVVICPVGYPCAASFPLYAQGPQKPPRFASTKIVALVTVFFVWPAMFDERRANSWTRAP
jgi:hypothetical protein